MDKDQNKEGAPPGEKFVGMDALKQTIASGGPKRKIVGLKIEGKRTARQDMKVVGGAPGSNSHVGVVTSACMSPTLGYPIAMAMG